MKRYIKWIKRVQEQLNVPVLVAGDIFHKWNSPAELINFAIRNLPKIYAVPGQHDLPHHNYEDIKKSAYWTLVEARKIHHIEYDSPVYFEKQEMMVWGFPWAFDIKAPIVKSGVIKVNMNVALIHKYIWDVQENKYHGAEEAAQVQNRLKELKGFKVAVFGDNHKGFHINWENPKNCNIINNGTLIRQKSDEKDYVPCIGLIGHNGEVSTLPVFGQDEDRWDDACVKILKEGNESLVEELVELLDSAGENSLNFEEVIRRRVQKKDVSKRISTIILKAMEK